MFVCSEARRVVLRREKTLSDREHGDTAMEINDNPTFIIDDYDIIPEHYLNNKKHSIFNKYLSQRRGSLGKFDERFLLK